MRQSKIRQSALIGIGVNLILFTSKLIIAIISRSVSLLSDAFNNLSDLFSSGISLASSYISNIPADENHPFGHGRSEYIATQFVSFFIIYVGIQLFLESIKQIKDPQPIEISLVLYLVLILSILLKGWMMMVNHRIAKKTESDLVEAVLIDSRNDVIASVLLLFAMLFQPHTDLPIDGIAGIFLSIIILYQGIQILWTSMSKLLGKAISDDAIETIDRIVHQHPEVLGYHNFKGHDYGPNHVHVSIDLELPDTMDLTTAHQIVDQIEKEIYRETKIDVVAHIDPISTNEELNKKVYQEVLSLGKEFFNENQIDNFLTVQGHYRTSVFFTLESDDFENIKTEFLSQAKETAPNLSFHIDKENPVHEE